jgi:hypothetical protein
MAWNVSSLREVLDATIYFNQSYSSAANTSLDPGWMEAFCWYYFLNGLGTAPTVYNYMKDSQGTLMDNQRLNSNTSAWSTTNIFSVMNAYNTPGTGLKRLAQSFQARRYADGNKTTLNANFPFSSAGFGQNIWANSNISMLDMIGNRYKRTSNWQGRSKGDGVDETFTNGFSGRVSIGDGAPDAFNWVPPSWP